MWFNNCLYPLQKKWIVLMIFLDPLELCDVFLIWNRPLFTWRNFGLCSHYRWQSTVTDMQFGPFCPPFSSSWQYFIWKRQTKLSAFDVRTKTWRVVGSILTWSSDSVFSELSGIRILLFPNYIAVITYWTTLRKSVSSRTRIFLAKAVLRCYDNNNNNRDNNNYNNLLYQ